jgi:hypothetical protein
MNRCSAGKRESERKLKCDHLFQVKRDLKLFEKTTLKPVSTFVKNTLPSQQSKQTILIANFRFKELNVVNIIKISD